MAVPQVAHFQSPEKVGFSPLLLLLGCAFPLLLLWQSRHIRPSVLRGSNGNSVMAAPQPLQVQFP